MTIQQKAIELAKAVKVGDEFKVNSQVMRVTEVTAAGCRLGMTDFYGWHQLQHFLTMKAITKI